LQLTKQRISSSGPEVLPMRCLVHIWKASEEQGRKPISLHILPLNASETLQSTERFFDEDALCRHLEEIGLSHVQVVLTLYNLRDERDAMWMNVEIPEPVAVQPSLPSTLAA